MSPTTMNMYLTTLRNFCNWLVGEKRLAENPVAYIPKLTAATERRRERRAYTVDELGRILAAADKEKKRFGMTDPVRTLLYRTATETGLRWSELRKPHQVLVQLRLHPRDCHHQGGKCKKRYG